MGSLFGLRDYWYNGNHREEEFSHNLALTVGNVDNDPGGENKIIFGSFSGILRVLLPRKKGVAQPEDTLVEEDFKEPILQLACRALEPVAEGKSRNLLAVLFSRQLLLLRLLREGNTTVEIQGVNDFLTTTYRLMVHQKISLQQSLYNFTCGTFGSASREMICVQSMNGQLTIVDHNLVVVQCFLPSSQFFLPGCLSYCPHKDYFITNNSAMNLLCYSLTSLSCNYVREDFTKSDNDEEQFQNSSEDVVPSWTFSLGDEAVGIDVCRHTRGLNEKDADIVVLCLHTLFVLSLDGQLRSSRRLDVESLCFSTYFVPGANAYNLLIGTVGGSVNVYSDMSLDWSAKMTNAAPQCLEVAKFFKTEGMIVTLSTDGTIAVNYLGTDPEEDPIQPLDSKEADYATMESELWRVQQAIKQANNFSTKDTASGDSPLLVKWESPSVNSIENGCMATVVLTLRNESHAEIKEDITIVVQPVEPVAVNIQQKVVYGIPAHEPVQIPFQFSTNNSNNDVIPSSIEAQAVVMYTSKHRANCSVRATIRLPFALVARPIPPTIKPQFVMQLNTDKDAPPSLLDLFSDMAELGEVTTNIMTIQYVNGVVATLLVSSNAGRFRLQGSTMDAIWLLADELEKRLYTHYGSNVRLDIPDTIPMESFFRVIEQHLAFRKAALEAKYALSRAAQMFRAVQKQLLILFRERNPSPVGIINTVFEESYVNLQKSADNVILAERQLKQADAMLYCSSRVIAMQLLIKCQGTLGNSDVARHVESLFTCPIGSDCELGWEDIIDSALAQILASSGITTALSTVNDSVSSAFDCERFKKRMNAFVDYLLRGSKLNFS